MQYDVIIVGAGAAGLMCAIEAGKRGQNVLLLDHSKTVGDKIRISGGGRCNFTNINTTPANFLSNNQHFCISALKRYTQFDFIELVEKYKIDYHEKTLGQQFCDGSAKQIVEMLVSECHLYGVSITLSTSIQSIKKTEERFIVTTNDNKSIVTESLVIATGGPSIPKMGATSWGYDVAKQFGINIIKPHPALVPFTLNEKILDNLKSLSGISVDATATCNGATFKEALLFTHRGLSGPAILQISSYWKAGDAITINLAANFDVMSKLKNFRESNPKQDIQKALIEFLPKRLAQYICTEYGYNGRIADLSNIRLQEITDSICEWKVTPSGTEGYRTAEVTRGGVSTDEISSKTFETKKVKGLYFIGEVVDVTGHLGGFNFQWAWSSGYAAGQYV